MQILVDLAYETSLPMPRDGEQASVFFLFLGDFFPQTRTRL